MPLETVGSTEALLQLLATYQGMNGIRPDPLQIWEQIASYVKQGGTYRFYPYSDYDPAQPAIEFAADLTDLIEAGFLRPLEDGTVELTPLGRCLAFARTVPPSLRGLAEKVLATASAHQADKGRD